MLTGRVVVMPSGRGSSSSSYVLAEAIRAERPRPRSSCARPTASWRSVRSSPASSTASPFRSSRSGDTAYDELRSEMVMQIDASDDAASVTGSDDARGG